MDDIEMDDDADNTADSNNAEDEERPEEVQDQTDDRITPSAEPLLRPKKEYVAISYDKYVAMMNLLVKKISDDDSAGGEGLTAEEIVELVLDPKRR